MRRTRGHFSQQRGRKEISRSGVTLLGVANGNTDDDNGVVGDDLTEPVRTRPETGEPFSTGTVELCDKRTKRSQMASGVMQRVHLRGMYNNI